MCLPFQGAKARDSLVMEEIKKKCHNIDKLQYLLSCSPILPTSSSRVLSSLRATGLRVSFALLQKLLLENLRLLSCLSLPKTGMLSLIKGIIRLYSSRHIDVGGPIG